MFADALESGAVVREDREKLWHVFGPYYARSVAVVPLSADVVVAFGSSSTALPPLEDAELHALAIVASESIGEVAASKRLADELEVVNAVRDLLRLPAGTFDETLQRVVEHARQVLSCDLGVAYVREPDRLAVSDPGGVIDLDECALRQVMAAIAERAPVPSCVQDARTSALPSPFSSDDGVLAYYLLGLRGPRQRRAPARAYRRGAAWLHPALSDARPAARRRSRGALRDVARPRRSPRRGRPLEARRRAADALTGLANRLAWDEATGAGTGRDTTASVMLVDCRGLKQANETHGLDVGDRLLRRVGEIIAGSVRADDLVARLGGDEFAVLALGADESDIDAIAGRIQATLVEEPPIESISPAVAIGAATTYESDLGSAQKLADARLREAKRLAPA